nr:MAG TPA: hypothetical protein [Caudoviricetes sp.]
MVHDCILPTPKKSDILAASNYYFFTVAQKKRNVNIVRQILCDFPIILA